MVQYRTHYVKPRRKGKKSGVSASKKKTSTKKKNTLVSDVYSKLRDMKMYESEDDWAINKFASQSKPKETALRTDEIFGSSNSNTTVSNLQIRSYFAMLLGINIGWDLAILDPEEYSENIWRRYIKWVKINRPHTYEREMAFSTVAKRIAKEINEADTFVWSTNNPEYNYWMAKKNSLWEQIQDYYT